MALLKAAVSARNAALTAFGHTLDGGTLNIYTGARPATPETAPSGTLLCAMALGTPAFNVPSGGSIPSTLIADAAILATGTAGYCRLKDNSGNGIVDGDVGLVGSGAFIEFSSLAFVAAVTLSVSAFSLNLPIGS